MTCINIWTNQSSGSLPHRHLKNMAVVLSVLGISRVRDEWSVMIDRMWAELNFIQIACISVNLPDTQNYRRNVYVVHIILEF